MSRINTGIRLTQKEAVERILSKCQKRNITFLGFDNEENRYTNNEVYLILKCNKCGHVWKTTNYTHFVNSKRNCPKCSKYRHFTDKERINRIKVICKERGFEFLGYVGNTFKGPNTKLHLKCKKCGEEWNTTILSNFIKNDRNSHTCGRKNPTYSPIKGKYDIAKLIKNITQKLKGTSLEFVSFEGEYNGYAHCHVLLRCTKCGKISNFAYHYIMSVKKKVLCKNCEYGGKFSDEEARRIVQKKAEYLDYTFLGFDNEENKYNGKLTYLILKCNKCGRVWKTTTFLSFKTSIIKCIGCANSWKMPLEITSVLKKEKIDFIEECRTKHLPWLKHKISLSLDIYIPEYKIGIECQGRQHFEPVIDFGGEKTFLESKERDKKKLDLCKANGVTLLYYDSENKHKEFLGEKVYNSQEEILNKIKELINE